MIQSSIAGLQPIPRDSNDKDTAAMLVVQTIEADYKDFVNDHQHGGDDVTRKLPISRSLEAQSTLKTTKLHKARIYQNRAINTPVAWLIIPSH